MASREEASRPTKACAHPADSLVRVSTQTPQALIATWCAFCGALKLEQGPSTGQWMHPKRGLALVSVAKIRRLVDELDGALGAEGT